MSYTYIIQFSPSHYKKAVELLESLETSNENITFIEG